MNMMWIKMLSHKINRDGIGVKQGEVMVINLAHHKFGEGLVALERGVNGIALHKVIFGYGRTVIFGELIFGYGEFGSAVLCLPLAL